MADLRHLGALLAVGPPLDGNRLGRSPLGAERKGIGGREVWLTDLDRILVFLAVCFDCQIGLAKS